MTLNPTELAKIHWDAVIVGTGMGGATLGYALARGGQKVLFLEKGENYLVNPNALRGDYMEVLVKNHPVPGTEEEIAINSGRWRGEIYDEVNQTYTRPYLGIGAGGSSAIYGMVMNRFFPSDFEPKRYHRGDTRSTLPDRWPVTYDEMRPFYEAAEELFRVHFGDTDDPLQKDPFPKKFKAPVPRHVATQLYEWIMKKKKLHPYTTPFACEWKIGCHFCQSVLCDKGCKNDSAKICLQPALENFGAELVTRFVVERLEANQGTVTAVTGRWQNHTELRFHGRRVILAAGALATPLLLLQSRSNHWPQGLANGSGAVGRNLMRHLIDVYLLPSIWNLAKKPISMKEIILNDFYEVDGVKYGACQPLGRLPPGFMAADEMLFEMRQTVPAWVVNVASFFRPVTALFLDALFVRSGALAPIMEDLPDWDNRVEGMEPAPDGRERISIHYKISAYDQERLTRFRRMVGKALFPYPYLRIPASKTTKLIAHACGTVRFGDDPKTSVLNKMNRAHEVENLYVVDASFFPSSGGINPSLTIAANALRVAKHLLEVDKNG